jgi:hypothetical protein
LAERKIVSFEIRDSEIDTHTLAQRIAQAIVARRARAAELGLDFDVIAGLKPGGELDQLLGLIRLSYQAIHLEPDHPPSPARLWRHPLGWLKQQFHTLVIYYVNRLGYRQMVFNAGTVRVLEHLLARYDEAVNDLRAQVDDLSARLQDAEHRRE